MYSTHLEWDIELSTRMLFNIETRLLDFRCCTFSLCCTASVQRHTTAAALTTELAQSRHPTAPHQMETLDEDEDEGEEVEYVLGAFSNGLVYQVHKGTVSPSGDYLADSWLPAHFLAEVRGEILAQESCTRIVMRNAENGELFAECAVDDDSSMVDTVDSSRYVVMKIRDEKSGRTALLGMGFKERTAAYDFKTTIRDNQRRIEFRKKQGGKQAPSRNYTVPTDQKISITSRAKSGSSKCRDRKQGSSGGFAPPPPGTKSRRQAAAAPTTQPSALTEGAADVTAATDSCEIDPFSNTVTEEDPFSSEAAPQVDPFADSPAPEFDPFANSAAPEGPSFDAFDSKPDGFGDWDPFGN